MGVGIRSCGNAERLQPDWGVMFPLACFSDGYCCRLVTQTVLVFRTSKSCIKMQQSAIVDIYSHHCSPEDLPAVRASDIHAVKCQIEKPVDNCRVISMLQKSNIEAIIESRKHTYIILYTQITGRCKIHLVTSSKQISPLSRINNPQRRIIRRQCRWISLCSNLHRSPQPEWRRCALGRKLKRKTVYSRYQAGMKRWNKTLVFG